MGVTRKFKMKSLNNKSVSKSRPIFIGLNQEGEPIILFAETKPFLDNEYNKALAELYNEVKLPKKCKLLATYTKEEQSLINAVEDFKKEGLITVYDETNPEFVTKKNELDSLKTILMLASFLKMDEEIEIEDGKIVTQWEYIGADKKKGLLGLAKYLASKEGMALSDVEVHRMSQEIDLLKKGYETVGEKYLKNTQETIEEMDRIKTKIEESSEVDETE